MGLVGNDLLYKIHLKEVLIFWKLVIRFCLDYIENFILIYVVYSLSFFRDFSNNITFKLGQMSPSFDLIAKGLVPHRSAAN